MKSGAAITWKSKKQMLVTLSTSEAEYMALSSASQEVVWLRKLMENLKENQKSATTVYEDNKSTIQMANNPAHHPRKKHIGLKYHFARDMVNNGTIVLQYCESKKMLADILMKPLARERFSELRSSLGLCSAPIA